MRLTRRAEWTRRTVACLAIRREFPPGGGTPQVVFAGASLLCRFPHLGPEFVALRHQPVAFHTAPVGEHLVAPRPHPGSSIAERVLDQPTIPGGDVAKQAGWGDSAWCVGSARRSARRSGSGRPNMTDFISGSEPHETAICIEPGAESKGRSVPPPSSAGP